MCRDGEGVWGGEALCGGEMVFEGVASVGYLGRFLIFLMPVVGKFLCI